MALFVQSADGGTDLAQLRLRRLADDALELSARRRSDVVLVDFRLGEGSAIDLVRELRRRGLVVHAPRRKARVGGLTEAGRKLVEQIAAEQAAKAEEPAAEAEAPSEEGQPRRGWWQRTFGA